ncbi:NifB/NifX family molybdenum-iron cluster-binding protein [Trichloromonas sp.]|uniref:NifB/NifX family molybdenum-iron cluster-binding protein n=1 Tax=Trichloromonas sp. TaxID=3069249 RepID=UPI003D816E52
MLIAVTSKTGTEVDQHFGHAERFLIYDYNQGNPQLVKEVSVEKYCAYVPDQPFRHGRFQGIAEAIDGCRLVVTAMIGGYPKDELKKLGIQAVVAPGPIPQALVQAVEAQCKQASDS